MAPTAKIVKDIFKDFSARRNAIIRALTSEVDDFYRLCDPDKKSLGLYGHPNGKWEVTASPENVPTVLPYPVLGINFARDGMNRKDWLSLIAIHSDSWLISVAFVFAGRLKRSQRQKLYSMINDLPTVYEVLTERNSIEDKPSMDSASGSKSQGSTKRSIDEQAENNPKLVDDSLKYAEDEHTESLCGSCGGKDNVDEFWIACDVCQRWFHGMCVKMTPSKAESIEEYECPSCSMKKTHCGSCGGKYSVDEFCMGCDVCKR